MLKLSDRIKSFIYRFQYLSIPDQFDKGKYFVQYSDGCKSRRMDYVTAKEYADRFNGQVIFKDVI